VRRSCPGLSAADVEDFVQSIMVALLRRMGEGEENPTYSSIYLQKMAYGVMVDELRRRGRRPATPMDVDSSDRFASAAPDPERAAASGETAAGIRDCVSRLVAPRRRAVTLHLLGCGVTEIARRSGWSGKRADNLLYRGLADLRRCLESKGLKP